MKALYQEAIERYRQRVFSFAYYSLRTREDAEDITQDVFIKLWQHWRKIDHDRLGAWLMRVAHNAVVDHVRRQKNAPQNVDQQEVLENTPAAQRDELETEEFQRQLEMSIAELKEPQRSILIMRDVQGLSYQEVEQTLNLSQSQVKVYLHRARRKLREDAALRRYAKDADLDQGSEDRAPEANEAQQNEVASHVKKH